MAGDEISVGGGWKTTNPGPKRPATLLKEETKFKETNPFQLFSKVARLDEFVDMLVKDSEVNNIFIFFEFLIIKSFL